MIAGIVVGGIAWSIYFSLFLIFPDPLSFAAALLVGPFAGGYFGTRVGGWRAATFLVAAGTITVLALSVTYIPHTSWEYPHDLWAGIGLFIALLVLGNLVFASFGSLVAIQRRIPDELKEKPYAPGVLEPAKDNNLRGTAPKMTNPLQTKIVELKMKESDLVRDLTVIKDIKGSGQISSELLQERENVIQKQLLDVILEKERLVRKAEGTR